MMCVRGCVCVEHLIWVQKSSKAKPAIPEGGKGENSFKHK